MNQIEIVVNLSTLKILKGLTVSPTHFHCAILLETEPYLFSSQTQPRRSSFVFRTARTTDASRDTLHSVGFLSILKDAAGVTDLVSPYQKQIQ